MERDVVGERTVCIDEMTGIQAIERKEKDLPLRPGKVKRQEARVYSSWNTGINRQLQCRHRSNYLSDLWRHPN
jgi:hypothetical protein